jgi:glycosyltransferase involved in cell wall biosynthesis
VSSQALVADGDELLRLLLAGPLGVAEVELSEGLESLRNSIGPPRPGRTILVLLRLHSHPLGFLLLADAAEDPQSSWVAAAPSELRRAVDAHLLADGCDPAAFDLWHGGGQMEDLPCLEARRRAIATGPPVSVVVATRDRAAVLEACLDRLLALDYPDYEVLVVDNDPSTDATAELVASLAAVHPTLRYLREDRRGLGAAHNQGIAEAHGEIIAFTDDDVVVDQHWLSELVAPFLADERVAGATGLILPAELETPAQVMLEAHGRFGKGFEDALYDLDEHRPDDPLFPFAAGRLGSGANMAFDAAWLRSRGGFDPAIGVGTPARGGDDLLAIFEVISSARTLAYRPGALIRHHHPRDPAAVRRKVYGYGVGLGAFLMSAALREPRVLLTMLRRAPKGWSYYRGRGVGSRKHPAFWPSSLSRLERRGLLWGPAAYGVSRLLSWRASARRPAP